MGGGRCCKVCVFNVRYQRNAGSTSFCHDPIDRHAVRFLRQARRQRPDKQWCQLAPEHRHTNTTLNTSSDDGYTFEGVYVAFIYPHAGCKELP